MYVDELERREVPPVATMIARALGLHRNTVAAALRDLPVLTYDRSWVPIRRDLLPLQLPVACKVLASKIDRRGSSEYLPSWSDLAGDLGWTRDRVARALRRARGVGLIVEEKSRKDARLRIRRCTKPPPIRAQNRHRRMHKTATDPCTKAPPSPVGTCQVPHPPMRRVGAHPNERLTGFIGRLEPLDGWFALRSERVRQQLEGGPHADSLFAVLTGAGLWKTNARTRWRRARELAQEGLTTEQLLALVQAAYEPRSDEGRVKRPAALLRTWLDAGELERRPPVPVGLELRRAIEQRERATASEASAELDSQRVAGELRAELPRWKPARVRELADRVLGVLERMGEEWLGPVRELAHLVGDRRGDLADVCEFVTRFPLEQLVGVLPDELGQVVLARARARRESEGP